MRSTSLIGIGALTAAALLGTCFTATAHAAGAGSGDDRGHNNELHGYRIVQQVGPGNSTPVTAYCPADGRVTGGGVLITSPQTGNRAILGTYPTGNGDGWVGVADTPGGNGFITVYAVCTRVGDNDRY